MKTGFNDRSDMKAIKVCIIDDHSVVRMGLKYMISYIPDAEEDIFQAVKAGAMGYILKGRSRNR